MLDAETAFRQHIAAIQQFRTQDLNEAMTRRYLVAPMLEVLGYQSPEELHLEVRVPNTGEFIDYELLVNGKPRAIVEAKAMRHEVNEQHAAQCVKYAALLGVQWCLITNGLVWAIYDAYAPVALTDKLVIQVGLDAEPTSVDRAWDVLSQFRPDALRLSEPLSEIIIERIITFEFQRPDSQVISAIRSAVRARVGRRVSSESIVAALSRMTSIELVREGNTTGRAVVSRERLPQRMVERSGLRDLIDAELLPSDASLEMKWKGTSYSARVKAGQIELNGRLFSTPSAAGAFVRSGAATNGGSRGATTVKRSGCCGSAFAPHLRLQPPVILPPP